MKRTPLVSVIIPCYNYGRYLTECLQSVAASNIDLTQIEILVIDDASTDDSGHIADTFGRENPDLNIRLIQNDVNLGLVRSRNRGIHHARGEFVFFLDADNYIGPDCLKMHADALINHPEAIGYYGPIQDFDDETNILLGLRSNVPFSYDQLLNGPYIDAMAIFRRRELMDLGMYDTKMPSFGWEDYELWLRMGKLELQVGFIDQAPLSYYRCHQKNMAQEVILDKYNQLIYYLKTIYPLKSLYVETDVYKQREFHQMQQAQLCYVAKGKEIKQYQAIPFPFQPTSIGFALSSEQIISKYFFQPASDFCKVKLASIKFLRSGSPAGIHYCITSNAIFNDGEIYLFDTKCPLFSIEFEQQPMLAPDEIVVALEILEIGLDALVTGYQFQKRMHETGQQTLQQLQLNYEATSDEKSELAVVLRGVVEENEILKIKLNSGRMAVKILFTKGIALCKKLLPL